MEFDEMQSILRGILSDDPPQDEKKSEPVQPAAPPTPVEQPKAAIAPAHADFEFDELLKQFDPPVMAAPEQEAETTEVVIIETTDGTEEADVVESEFATEDGGPDAEDGPEFEGFAERAGIAASETPSLDELLEEPATPVIADTQIIFKDSKEAAQESIPMPVFTTDELAASLDIRNFASLVTLNTSRWSGKVKDRKASEAAATATGAQAEAFETQKRLLAGADEKLKKVHKAIDDARTRHYAMTLPWSTVGRTDAGKRTGGRMLPHTCFQEYITAMGKAKQDMERCADEFESGYTAAITKAKQHLGQRFDPTEYPNPVDIRRHFGLSFDFHPIPVAADFQGLADQQISALSNALEKKTRVMVENAMQETWARTYELVQRAAEKFSDTDAMFHFTLIDQLREAARTIKFLNVTGDEMIEKVRTAIDKHLTKYDADDIRKDDALRLRLGKIASAVLKGMQEHAGGG